MVVRAQGLFHGFSYRNLHLDAALLQKFWKCPNPEKCPYSKIIFLDQFLEFIDFEETAVIGVFGVAEFESDLKIWVASFSGSFHTIFAGNFCST